jgi:hypothetical protein
MSSSEELVLFPKPAGKILIYSTSWESLFVFIPNN